MNIRNGEYTDDGIVGDASNRSCVDRLLVTRD